MFALQVGAPTLDRILKFTFFIRVGVFQDVDSFGISQAFEAVSYTHLRAHETVLDLVCRLLLEKKKKTHQTARLYCRAFTP